MIWETSPDLIEPVPRSMDVRTTSAWRDEGSSILARSIREAAIAQIFVDSLHESVYAGFLLPGR